MWRNVAIFNHVKYTKMITLPSRLNHPRYSLHTFTEKSVSTRSRQTYEKKGIKY